MSSGGPYFIHRSLYWLTDTLVSTMLGLPAVCWKWKINGKCDQKWNIIMMDFYRWQGAKCKVQSASQVCIEFRKLIRERVRSGCLDERARSLLWLIKSPPSLSLPWRLFASVTLPPPFRLIITFLSSLHNAGLSRCALTKLSVFPCGNNMVLIFLLPASM